MCGIAGFISTSPNYNATKLVYNMLVTMRHRGPDLCGVKTMGSVTLGMVRLNIIDDKPHDIPLFENSGKRCIVYNGEVYNHEDIRSQYHCNYPFATLLDTETLLVDYAARGKASLCDLNGMYAFAVLDTENGETVLVRDKAGEKPLYYCVGHDYFAFASEAKALLNIVEPIFNPKAISYRAFNFTVGTETLFKNIYQLEPGNYLVHRNGSYQIYSYWKIWDNYIEVKDDEKAIVDDLCGLVEDAILMRDRNRAFDIGCLISGGVDSSLISCIAKPDVLYTAQYEFPDFDEVDYARLVARQINRPLEIIKPTKEDFIVTGPDIAYALDFPCTWTSFTLWMLQKRIAGDGIRIVLTGDGADEVFGGYHRYHILNHEEQLYDLPAMKMYKPLIDSYFKSPVDRYIRLANRDGVQFDPDVHDCLDRIMQAYYKAANQDVLHFMGMSDLYTSMQVILQMSDRVSMNFSIENRSPFLDHRLMQYAFSMPSKYKIRDGIAKWVLKKVAAKFIPREIVDRKDKRGFSAPVNAWFNWVRHGKYDRSDYTDLAFSHWAKAYKIRSEV